MNKESAHLIYGAMGLGGTWEVSTYDSEAVDQAESALHAAAAIGIEVIDTADIYRKGSSERIVGEVLANDPSLAKHFRIQTKCGILPGDSATGVPTRYNLSGDYITRALDASLERLGVDHVDTLLLHRPDPLTAPSDTAQGVRRALEEGKIRAWGVSNMSTWQIALLARELGMPAVNQLELSLHARSFIEAPMNIVGTERSGSNYAAGTVEYCAAQGIEVQAWSPLAKGRFCPDNDQPVSEVDTAPTEAIEGVQRLANKYDTTPDTIVLWWLSAHPAQIKPVVGTSRAARIFSYADANHQPSRLTRDEWYELVTLARGGMLP